MSPHLITNDSAAPIATTADLAWLAGTWDGDVAGENGRAEATYTEPRSGLIAGVTQVLRGGEVVAARFLTIGESPSGLEMTILRVGSQPDVHEDPARQTLRLISVGGGRFVFGVETPGAAPRGASQTLSSYIVRVDAHQFREHTHVLDERGRRAVVHVAYRRRA